MAISVNEDGDIKRLDLESSEGFEINGVDFVPFSTTSFTTSLDTARSLPSNGSVTLPKTIGSYKLFLISARIYLTLSTGTYLISGTKTEMVTPSELCNFMAQYGSSTNYKYQSNAISINTTYYIYLWDCKPENTVIHITTLGDNVNGTTVKARIYHLTFLCIY